MNMSNSRWKIPVIIVSILALIGLAVFGALVLINEYSLDVALRGAAEITLEYGEAYEESGAVAVYYGTVFQQEPLDVAVTVEGSVDVSRVGTYVLQYNAAHEELTDSARRTVHVVDTVSPEISLLGEVEITLPVGEEYVEPGWTAFDNYSGDLSEAVTASGQLDPAVPGSYVLTYSVSDISGNSCLASRTVTYVDVTAPVLTLLGDAEVDIEPNSDFADPGYTAADDCDGDVSAFVTVDSTVDSSVSGEYTVTYTVADAAGNIATAQRKVTVKDLTPPELILDGDSVVELTIGYDFEDPGYSAMDNCDGDLTEQVAVTDNINMYLPGTYTVTYTVTDANGNTAEACRTVVYYDVQAKVTGGIIYLTYDDGPSYNTSQLLDVLDRYGVKVTFFVVNTGYGDTMARAASSGHTIAIHTASHKYEEIYASEEAYFNDLYYMQSLIQSYTGQTAMMLRFPGGSSNTSSYFNPGIMTRLTQLVEEKGFRYFDWNVDSRDASGSISGWAEAAYNVIRGASNTGTSVVLMHDSYSYCVRATERVIQWGLANGYTFAALTYGSPGCHHGVNN